MIRLVVTPRAKRDRDEILRYLAKEAGDAVTRILHGHRGITEKLLRR